MNAGTLTSEDAQKYKDASITNIKRLDRHPPSIVYAHIVDKNNKLLVSATLDYCCQRMEDASKHF